MRQEFGFASGVRLCAGTSVMHSSSAMRQEFRHALAAVRLCPAEIREPCTERKPPKPAVSESGSAPPARAKSSLRRRIRGLHQPADLMRVATQRRSYARD